jgi:glycosyltransferase involved in cell wall biosynthesis
VALIIGQLGPGGGAERQLARVATGLSRQRWATEVFCLSGFSEPLASVLREGGVPVNVLPSASHADPFRLARLTAALWRGKFDLSHSWLPADNLYHRLAALLARRRPVLTSFRTSVPCFTGLRDRLERWSYRTSDRVITNSRAGERFLVRDRGVCPSCIRVVPNGMDFSRLDDLPRPSEARRSLGLPPDFPVMLFLGWFRPEKNFSLLLAAAQVLRQRRPELRWLLVGDGPSREQVENEVDGRGLGDRVVLTGALEDVRQVMAAADLFVLTSDFEGLPGALLEALAAGLPAITTDVGDCREVIEDSGGGSVVPVGDADALAQAIERELRQPSEMRKRGLEARARVRERYGVPGMLRAMESVYEEVCED